MGEIRFVGTGETRGYSYLVCKKEISSTAKNRANSVSYVRNQCLRPLCFANCCQDICDNIHRFLDQFCWYDIYTFLCALQPQFLLSELEAQRTGKKFWGPLKYLVVQLLKYRVHRWTSDYRISIFID